MYAKCPKCGSEKTHSSRVRPGERTTSTLFLKPMRCRQCKERFWVQNRGAYVAAGAMVLGGVMFLGLIWLVVTYATRNQDMPLLPQPAVAATDPQADLRSADARAPEVAPVPPPVPVEVATPPGLKGTEDRAITVEWYRENAEKGDLDAQYKLGLLHLTGKGALQDFAEAAKWLKLAADQGHSLAQYHLGLIYRVGHGVPTDQAQAYKWLNLAAAAGVSQAVLVRNEVLRQLSADQLAQAQKASREWQASRLKPNAQAAAAAAAGSSNNAAPAAPSGTAAAAAAPDEAKAALSQNGGAPPATQTPNPPRN
jgi:uncharacterized protein